MGSPSYWTVLTYIVHVQSKSVITACKKAVSDLWTMQSIRRKGPGANKKLHEHQMYAAACKAALAESAGKHVRCATLVHP